MRPRPASRERRVSIGEVLRNAVVSDFKRPQGERLNAAALVPTAAHSASVRGTFSLMPLASTIVDTESQISPADGITMPFMICFTVATGGAARAVAAAAAGAAVDRAVRSAAMTKAMPLTNSAALTANSQ